MPPDRLGRSERELEAARRDLADGFVEQACGHAYYAAFYMVQELVTAAGRSAKTHSGTATIFTELVRDLGGDAVGPGLLSQLRQTREDTTYRFVEPDRSEAEEAISQAEQVIAIAKELLTRLP